MRRRERSVRSGVFSGNECSLFNYAQLRNRIRALLAQHSVKLPENERIYTREGRAWLDRVALKGSDAHLLQADCELHDNIEVQIASTDTLINKLAVRRCALRCELSQPA
jgi:hypothetical protein